MNETCEISEKLNGNYHEKFFIIDFAFHIGYMKWDCNRLEKYLITKSGMYGEDIYTMTGNGRLRAIVGNIENSKSKLHNKIVNYLNNVEKKSKKTYTLTVLDTLDLNYEKAAPKKPFDFWLSQSIYLIEKRGKKWDFKFCMKCSDDDFINRIDNTKYIDCFRNSETHSCIQEYLQNKKAKRDHKKNTELIKEELDKKLFIKKINTHFGFTENKSDYLSKRDVCNLLGLDYKSKGDIKRLNIILTDYGVKYDKLKMIKGDRGVFFNISLK